MAIKLDLQKIVDVNIVHKETIESVSTRDTFVILTDAVSTETLLTELPTNLDIYDDLLRGKIYNFFTNNGKKLLLVPSDVSFNVESSIATDTEEGNTTGKNPVEGETVTATFPPREISRTISAEGVFNETFTIDTKSYTYGASTTNVVSTTYVRNVDCKDLERKVNALDDKYIVVSLHLTSNVFADDIGGLFLISKRVSETIDNNKGIHRKIIVALLDSLFEDAGNLSLAIKTSSVLGADSTIGAYLTGIDVYDSTKLNSYAYTTESNVFDNEAVEIDDSLIGNIANIKTNFDMKIAGYYRNIGGNLSTGEIGIVDEFVLIILQQTLTDKLAELLTAKIKGQKGVGEIKATMTEELEKYRLSGYLVNNEIWNDNDLVINGNTVITKNTPLNLGYYIYVFPFSTRDRRTVETYVILATEKGIRAIVVNGLAI